MRKLRFIVLALALALALGGIAIARSGGGADKIEPATAEFRVTAEDVRTRTCQTSDEHTIHITRGTWRGQSTGHERLTGALVIRATAVVDQDSGLGFTKGHARVRSEDGRFKAHARLSAVNIQRGKLDGFVTGHTHERGGPHWRLLGNFSATFNEDGSELTGQLGADEPVPPTNSAVFHRGHCRRSDSGQQQSQQQGDERRGARGPRGDRGGRGPKGPRGPR
jgi:hypothetical protein